MLEVGLDFYTNGKRIGLVPTMGNLHEGHLSLVRLLDGRCDVKAASIFVNPIQFGQSEDYERYPHNEEHDLELLAEEGCSLVFMPEPEEMYPERYQTYIDVERLAKPLCGRFRPGHFRGVATVVMRLFTLTRCAVAAFGLKDYQQAMVLRRMNEDLHLNVELIFGDTVRESDGIAMSSRNAYLSLDERRLAGAIPRAFEWARSQAENQTVTVGYLRNGIERILAEKPGINIQYIEIVDPDSLQPLEETRDRALVALAVFIGSTRLIDNIVVGPASDVQPIKGVVV